MQSRLYEENNRRLELPAIVREALFRLMRKSLIFF